MILASSFNIYPSNEKIGDALCLGTRTNLYTALFITCFMTVVCTFDFIHRYPRTLGIDP